MLALPLLLVTFALDGQVDIPNAGAGTNILNVLSGSVGDDECTAVADCGYIAHGARGLRHRKPDRVDRASRGRWTDETACVVKAVGGSRVRLVRLVARVQITSRTLRVVN